MYFDKNSGVTVVSQSYNCSFSVIRDTDKHFTKKIEISVFEKKIEFCEFLDIQIGFTYLEI